MLALCILPQPGNMNTDSTPVPNLEGQNVNNEMVSEKERLKILVGEKTKDDSVVTPPLAADKGKAVVANTNLNAMVEASQKGEVSTMAMAFFKSQNEAIDNMRKQQEEFLKSLMVNNPPRPKRRHPEDGEYEFNIVPQPKIRRTEGDNDHGGENSQSSM